MDDTGLGEIIVLVAALGDAVRQVDVLAVHEEGLIKQPNLVQSFATHEHESAREDLAFVGLVIGEMPHIVPRKPLRMWEELRETEHLVEGSCRSRQSSFGFRKEVALAIHHLHAKTSRIGMGVHEVEAFGESVVLHHRVGVEQEHILACRDADGLVVGTAEANVFLVGDDLNLGELLCQHLQRSIN